MATNTGDLTAIPPSTTAERAGHTNPLADIASEEITRLRAELEITRLELSRARAENSRQLCIEQLHATMLANVLDAVIAFDNQKRIRYLNGAAERQYAVRARDVIGAPLQQVFRHCWLNPADEALVTHALQSAGRWRGEYQQELADGTRLHVDAAFSVLRDEAGNPLGTLACMRDVSDRASMQNALHDIADFERTQSELAHARDELRKQVTTLTRLRDLATQPASGDDPDALLQSILRTAVDVHGASHGLISLVDNRTGGLQPAASINLDARAVRQMTGLLPEPGGGACGSEFSGPRRVVIYDIETEPCMERFGELARRIGFRAIHSTPVLTREGLVLGVLSVHFKQPRRPTEMEMQVAEVCARQVGDAIEAATNRLALRESEARFRTMADNAPVMVWVADDEHSCTYLSKSWCEFTGQNENDGLGFGWVNVVHPDDREAVYTEFVSAVEDRRPLRVECRFRRHDGTYRWCIDTATPRFSTDGTFVGFIGSVLDITERKAQEEALRQSEKVYRAIGESLDYGIWICDADGRNRYVSESFLRLVGLTQDECSLFGWVRHLHPAEAQQTLTSWRECVRNGGIWNSTHRFKGVDGEYHSILARGLPVRDEQGNVVCWAGINLDVGREQQAEAAWREADRRKDDFLALLSHELRNPLAPIRSALELLKLQPAAGSETRGFEIIDRQLDNLVGLVDDLLDLSRISRGKLALRPESVPLADIIDSAVEAIRPSLDEAGHALEIDLPQQPVTLHGDRMRLAQMVSNLLDNSAKYTPRGGRVQLRAAVCANEVRISVSDDGIGIDADSLQAIFNMFSQLDPSRAHIGGGLGVGLALVKSLAQMHGGQIVAESPGEGRGSTFIITLPANAAQQETQQPQATPAAITSNSASTSGSCRILIADDNPDAARTLALLLDVMGHHTRIVNDGLQAVAAVQSFAPDFVFMDIGMPKLDGIEATRRIRELVLARQPRIIAVAGWGQASDRERSQSAGMDHHLVKPITLQTLQTLIEGNTPASSLH